MDSGIAEAKPSPTINGLRTETSSKSVASSTKNNSSWDEDWGPNAKGTITSSQSSIIKSSPVAPENPVSQITPSQPRSSSSAVSSLQAPISCPSVDIEWPPRASSQLGDTESHVKTSETSTMSSFEDIDPFANWPPRPSGSLGGSGISNNGNLGSALNKNGPSLMSNTVNQQNSPASDLVGLNMGNNSSTTTTTSRQSGSLNPQNSLGFQKQNQGFPASNISQTNKSTDLGSIFASEKNELIAPKLAPPPLTAVGGGRGLGRGRGRGSVSSTKSNSEKPPLLDLLG